MILLKKPIHSVEIRSNTDHINTPHPHLFREFSADVYMFISRLNKSRIKQRKRSREKEIFNEQYESKCLSMQSYCSFHYTMLITFTLLH